MAYYSYYQQQYPYWGQQQYANQYANQAFVAPPLPTYQPQPSWTGHDFYNAHYGQGGQYENDVGMFDYVWGRIKSLVGASAVGRQEARHWHHRVYGGLVDITTLLPSDLGAAAGYEALRLFDYHRAVYRQPLMDDREREEEALAGLAIAEATKLWSYCGRPQDKYGRRESCEVAAATAERLFRRNRRRERERDLDEDLYGDYDDAVSTYGGYSSGSEDGGRRRRARRQRRRSSVGLGYGGAGAGGILPGAVGVGVPAAGYQPSYGGQQMLGVQPAQLGVPGSYGGASPMMGGSPLMGGGLAMPGVQYQAAQPTYVPAYGAGAGVVGGAQYGMGGGGLGVPTVGRQRASSFTYPASPGYY